MRMRVLRGPRFGTSPAFTRDPPQPQLYSQFTVHNGVPVVVDRAIRPFTFSMSSLRVLRASHLNKTLNVGRAPFRAVKRNASTSAAESNPFRTGLYATVFVVSTGLFAAYYLDSRSAIHRYVLNPVLRYTLDAEASHKLAVKVLRSGLGPRDTQVDDEVLAINVSLSSPLWTHVLIRS